MGIRNQAAGGRIGNVLCQRQVNLFTRQFVRGRTLDIGQHDAVITDLDFDDLGDAVAGALVDLRLPHAPGRIGDVRVLDTGPGTKQLEPTAGSRGLDLGRTEIGGAPESLRDHGGKRVNGR